MSAFSALAAVAPPLLAMMPIAIGQDSAPRAADTDIVQIRRDAADRMTVPVRVLEKGPFRFLIDTGAENTVLSHDVAQQLAIVPSARAMLIGVAGTEMVDTVVIDQLDLGRRSYYALTAPLLHAADIGADGILGLDSLQDQRVLMDFRRNVLAIDDAKRLGGDAGFEIVVRAKRRSGQLIMTNALIDGVKVDVVIDTGAQSTIGNTALLRALGRRGKTEVTVLTSVTGQQLAAQVAVARRLEIEGLAMSNIVIAFADAPPFKHLGLAEKPAILLGVRELRAFPRVAIDFPTRRVLFDLPRQTDPSYFFGAGTRLP